MDKFVILKDVSDDGIEKLHELQKQGILRIVEPNATILTWLTPERFKDCGGRRIRKLWY